MSDECATCTTLRDSRDRWHTMCTQAWSERDYASETLRHVEAELARLRADLAEWHKLRDPANLHANLLRGLPARLTRETYLHLAGDAQEPADYAEIATLRADLERVRDWQRRAASWLREIDGLPESPSGSADELRALLAEAQERPHE